MSTTTMTRPRGGDWAGFWVAITLMAAIIILAIALFGRPARGDGMNGPPPNGYARPGVVLPPPGGSPGCLMSALQLGYLTGRREVAYAATEACIAFTGARGVHLPYGAYGPYVPTHLVPPPGWLIPRY